MLSCDRVHIGLVRQTLLHRGYIDIPSFGASMFPLIIQGNVCRFVDIAAEPIQVGDVVLFLSHSGHLVGHRVHDIKVVSGTRCFLVKGDTNFFPDGWVSEHDVLGRLLYVEKTGFKVHSQGWSSRTWGKAVLAYPRITKLLRLVLKVLHRIQRLQTNLMHGHEHPN